MKISQTFFELLPGQEIMMEGQTDGQSDSYRASADFVWCGPNENGIVWRYMPRYVIKSCCILQ